MAVVCLLPPVSNPDIPTPRRVDAHTCNRPFNSLSPRNFTNTTSFSDRRTRSSGSLTGLALASGSSPGEAMCAVNVFAPKEARQLVTTDGLTFERGCGQPSPLSYVQPWIGVRLHEPRYPDLNHRAKKVPVTTIQSLSSEVTSRT